MTLLESDTVLGGLAGTFDTCAGPLEKFYHHWYLSDRAVLDLVAEIGLGQRLVVSPSRTGMYFANRFFRLSSPLDLLRFRPLRFRDRLRLGWMTLRVRRVREWKPLEHRLVRDWVISLAGQRVWEVVWEPLLRGKFGRYADEVAAVWLWNKLKLRGASRSAGGAENLAYVDGGFGVLVDRLVEVLRERGVRIHTATPALRVESEHGRVRAVRAATGTIACDQVLVTTPIPQFLELCPGLPADYTAPMSTLRYLANVCLVLVLTRSLSDTYWLNVNDPAFPFVAVIEHTNFAPPEKYRGCRLVYLSKYLDEADPLFAMSAEQMLEFSLPHLQRMFPAFSRSWIREFHLWKARHSQPVVTRNYGARIPAFQTPIGGLWLCTMAQIYPQDRGTNYAVEYGRRVARQMLADTSGPAAAPGTIPISQHRNA